MAKQLDSLTARQSLDEICTVPDKIISVYSLEKHVWDESNSPAARRARRPELQTIEEFQLDPVRPFLTDVLRNMAAPYRQDRRDTAIGQGYWIQAEFGSGKSHLLCLLSALALGRKEAWEIIHQKEEKAGRGRRESLYRFWQEGIEAKSGNGLKGIFVIVKTLVGAGGGTVGISEKGKRLTEYILDAAKEQIEMELGKNLSLYPTELLADRFIKEDLDRYRNDLRKFLRDPKYFEEDEFEEVDDFIRDIQQDKSPEYKRSCGNKLWRFYTEYLKVHPHIAAETEEILKHMVETIMAEGYSGVLLVLDEVSLFMKDRDEGQRTDDEKTLVVLSNRLAKIHNLPIWTICAAQQAIESKMGVKNIIADDRLKLVKLLEEDKDYYDIVLARVREIKAPGAVGNYYLHYKKGFSWPNSIGETEFRHFFPFHKPAIEVLRAITYELTTTRSAIHFMHQTLKHQIKNKGRELIRLWELFDEAVRYEEDPSGVHAGLVAIKTKKEDEYRAYEAGKRQIDGLTKGYLKVYRDKAIKIIQTLFLYHIAKTRQQGITPEEIANSVLIERDEEASIDENIQHYETLSDNLKKELRQIVQTLDEESRPRYRFDPVFTGVDPRDEFRKARDDAESNEVMKRDAWEHLLALDEWPVKTQNMTIDLSSGVQSVFRDISPFVPPWDERPLGGIMDQKIEINWQGKQIAGLVGMRDLGRIESGAMPLPPINSEETDLDFSVFISASPVTQEIIHKILNRQRDPRLILWTPDNLTHEERERLIDFAAYRKMVFDWQGKETEDAVAVINWVFNTLQTKLGTIKKIVDNSYARGRMDTLNNTQMEFHVAGELPGIISPIVDRVLSSTYESRDIVFEPPFIFRKEEGVKVINGIVKTGNIPKGAKPNQNISAAQNFGFGLKIIKKSAEKALDTSGNPYIKSMWDFIDEKLADQGQIMKIETIYKNFMGVGGPKDYGLTRRIAQIFLLCLVREGKIRLGISQKSGLMAPTIDYSNIADIDFSAKILDSLSDIQKMAKPEKWDVLLPYAEKLLEEQIPQAQDDAVISGFRTKLRALFKQEKEESQRIKESAKALFEEIGAENPYEHELSQIARMFSQGIEAGNDIDLILYVLRESFGYCAFEKEESSQTEVDDLANRMRNYRDIKHFLGFEKEIRTAHAYCAHILPERQDLNEVRKIQKKVAGKLKDLQPYIDSDIKLRAELIGKSPPDAGETGTLGMLIHEYTTLYCALHETVLNELEKQRNAIEGILEGEEMRALKIMEGVTALQPPVSEEIEEWLSCLLGGIFNCPSPSRASIEGQIKKAPVHECGLSFQNVDNHLKKAEDARTEAHSLFEESVKRKMEIFLNPTVRTRLEQGMSDPEIAGILGCKDVSDVRACLTKACLSDPSITERINRYLKRIVIKRVSLSDFKPHTGTVEKGQIPRLVEEFRNYIEEQIESIDVDEDTLPMLQVD